MTPIERAIELLSLAGIGQLYEPPISPQAVFKWVSGSVPAERCPDIEAATHGAVTCEELRPDVNWAVLRKLHTKKVGAGETAQEDAHEANVSAASSGCKKLNLKQMKEAA